MSFGALVLLGQNLDTKTDSLQLYQADQYQTALEHNRCLGERAIPPPGLEQKWQLTNEQRAELKPIERAFANTSGQYQTANQPRIDAGPEAIRQARVSKDASQIQAARTVATSPVWSSTILLFGRQINRTGVDGGSNHHFGRSANWMARKSGRGTE
jgi:hypothetical protein